VGVPHTAALSHQFYTEFAQTARREFTRSSERAKKTSKKMGVMTEAGVKTEAGEGVKEEGEEGEMRPFQTLDFLIRDWQNFEDDEDVARCLAEMPEVLEEALTASVEDDGTRTQIKAAFEKIGCFLLPHPGIPITKKDFQVALI
jgi:atlastin